MNLRDLANRLKGDIRRSPIKAAVLAILAVVAIWFWVPLMTKWFGKDPISEPQAEKAADVSADTAVATFAQPPKQTTSNEKTAAPSCPWTELLAWMGEEELTKPATLAPSFVDPFGQPETTQPEEVEADAQRRQRELANVDPRQLGLVLNSTVIGPNSRLASINGHICPLEAEILVTPSGLTIRDPGENTRNRRAAGEERGHSTKHIRAGRTEAISSEPFIEFQLTEIQPTHITLSRGTRSYRIDLKRFESTGQHRSGLTREQRRDG